MPWRHRHAVPSVAREPAGRDGTTGREGSRQARGWRGHAVKRLRSKNPQRTGAHARSRERAPVNTSDETAARVPSRPGKRRPAATGWPARPSSARRTWPLVTGVHDRSWLSRRLARLEQSGLVEYVVPSSARLSRSTPLLPER